MLFWIAVVLLNYYVLQPAHRPEAGRTVTIAATFWRCSLLGAVLITQYPSNNKGPRDFNFLRAHLTDSITQFHGCSLP